MGTQGIVGLVGILAAAMGCASVPESDSAPVIDPLSDDPGRYIGNNLFYELTRSVADQVDSIGFVHLPIVHSVTARRRAELAEAVRIIVETSL